MSDQNTFASASTVYFVGAGPGDPELLTVKAYSLVRRADVVLHDDLVPAAIVSLAAPHAQVINVGKRCGAKKITQEQINAQMIDAARRGLGVVRLKSGDPGIFGRLAEEIEALDAADVPFEVIPGITAGIAAASTLGASLTDRRTSSRIVIVSGHHAVNHERANDWRDFAREDTTFIVYMPGNNLADLRRELLEADLPPDLPAVLVSRASTSEQRVWPGTVGELDKFPPMEAPTVLLLGRSLARAANNAASKLLSSIVQDSACSSLHELA